MREALLATQQDIPFNNFTGILSSAGISFPPELGGDCVIQARDLVEKLRKKGISANFLEAANRKHVSVIAGRDDDAFYLDPCLYQNEPNSLAAAFGKEMVSIVDARPVVDELSSHVAVVGMPHKSFAVSAASYSKVNSFRSPFWQAKYALGNQVDELPKDYGYPTSTPPNTFVIRSLDGKGNVLEIRREAFSRGEFWVGKMENLQMYRTSVDEITETPEAEAIVLELARLVGVEASAVLGAMVDASRVCIQRHGMRAEGVR